jgi:hypothetical protein
MLEVTSADYIDGYKIHLCFNTGESGVIDLKDSLWGPMFEPLKDIEVFKRFRLSETLHTLCWENDADFAPEYLLDKMIKESPAISSAIRQ